MRKQNSYRDKGTCCWRAMDKNIIPDFIIFAGIANSGRLAKNTTDLIFGRFVLFDRNRDRILVGTFQLRGARIGATVQDGKRNTEQCGNE